MVEQTNTLKLVIDTRITAHSGRADQHVQRRSVIYNNFYRSHDDDDVIVLTSRTVPAGDVIWQRSHCQRWGETLGLPEPARTTTGHPPTDVRTRSTRYFNLYSHIIQCAVRGEISDDVVHRPHGCGPATARTDDDGGAQLQRRAMMEPECADSADDMEVRPLQPKE